MNRFFKILVGVLLISSRIVLGFLARAIELLSSSAQTTPANDELSNSVRGGIMNHRTGKFDDGSDPGGWYERD